MIQTPKIYLNDSGLLAHLLGATGDRMQTDGSLAGMLLEKLHGHGDPKRNDLERSAAKDPNSSAALAERQVSYVRSLGLTTPYTPQMIVDGIREAHANDPAQLSKELQDAASVPKIPARIDVGGDQV